MNLAGTHKVFEATGLGNVVADLEGLRRATQISGLDSSQRIYAERMMEAYLGILREGRGAHFDSQILDLFFDRIDEILDLKQALDEPGT